MPCFFCFNDTSITEFSTLSLHDALPISAGPLRDRCHSRHDPPQRRRARGDDGGSSETDAIELAVIPDRKSTRLNSSHRTISYAVFCLKKKKTTMTTTTPPSRQRRRHSPT